MGTSSDSGVETALLKAEVRTLKENNSTIESILQVRDAALDQPKKPDASVEEAKVKVEQLQEQPAYEKKQRKKWSEEEDEGDLSEPNFR